MVFETLVELSGSTMNKLLVTTTVAFLALTALRGSGAQAGLNVRIKLPVDFSSVQKTGCYDGDCDYEEDERDNEAYEREDDEYERSGRRPAARAQPKRTAKPTTVAKSKPEARKLAETEGSSATTADEEEAESSTTGRKKKLATANELGCKSFFASAGMTLSVPCE
jgi:septal ring-binding cell division protein DamX